MSNTHKKQKISADTAPNVKYDGKEDEEYMIQDASSEIKDRQKIARVMLASDVNTALIAKKVKFAKDLNEWITLLCSDPDVKIEAAVNPDIMWDRADGVRAYLMFYPPERRGDPFYPGQTGGQHTWWDIGNEPFSWKAHGGKNILNKIPVLSCLDVKKFKIPESLKKLEDRHSQGYPGTVFKAPLIQNADKQISVKLSVVSKAHQYEEQKFVIVESSDSARAPVGMIVQHLRK